MEKSSKRLMPEISKERVAMWRQMNPVGRDPVSYTHLRAEEKILKDLDRELEAGKKSLVIPAAYNKNGSLSSRSKTASKEQFEELCAYVNDKIRENGTDVYKRQSTDSFSMWDFRRCGWGSFHRRQIRY